MAKPNEHGELHISSQGLIKSYLGGYGRNSFYDDQVGRWFKTGDLAIMGEDGMIWITGRIQDRG